MPESLQQPQSFSAKEAAAVTGVTVERLDAYCSRGQLIPSVVSGQGRGSRRRYSFADLVAVYALDQLRIIGVTADFFKPVVEHLRGLPNLETEPPDVLFLDRDGTVHSGASPDPDEQRRLWQSEGKFMVLVPVAWAVQTLLNNLCEDDEPGERLFGEKINGEGTDGRQRGSEGAEGQAADGPRLGANGADAGAPAGDRIPLRPGPARRVAR